MTLVPLNGDSLVSPKYMVMHRPMTNNSIKALLIMFKYEIENINSLVGINHSPYEYVTHLSL